MKKTLVLMLLVFAVFAFSFSAYAETYVVGTSAGFPPFEYVEDGEIVGFDMDLITEIGKRQGFEVEFRDISFDSLPPALTTGSIDIIAAAMTITEERKELFNFSDPYYSANQSVLVHEDSEVGLPVLFGDNDIGVQTGTTGDLWVQDHLVEPGILTGNVRNYDSFVLVIRDLSNRNIDGVVLDKPVGETYSQGNPVKVVAEIITGEEYGMAVAKGNDELLEKINAGLEEVIADGTMDELIEKYFE
ncbi:basic amino acid ABC transporter substrate-binding protein [Halanaerobium sp. Z-7514]|uniref:Basic amino acid ABC transporter substrate-binding protein n=1 Tax=Halanaerobium polyolivorans TaxID=2886943 RepID=A0AAW4X1H6_9FIRM|nr:basic amino acid ABC transporter substrate-binding protein [Halanaerobium polyolivorans]MCC3145625.1 basic amino acid ABC transporter substrate-binding protein [Halanaerobium polyolivorans]